MKQRKFRLFLSLGLLSSFVLWTLLVRFVDVQQIGPDGSSVGFAGMNSCFHTLTGVHMELYTVTDWLGLVPLAFIIGFALLGLVQWIQRKHLLQVDRGILVLGGFYLVTMAAYLLFEIVVINYRPVLIGGILEASYPSSTTMLVMTVMPTAILQLRTRLRQKVFRGCVIVLIAGFTVFMVIGRLLSGVHWLTDIIGGLLLSAGLVTMYDSFTRP
jgi:undecaprenyl-diphosphatase